MSEFLPAFGADADAKVDTLTNKSIKYLFYRCNYYLVYKGFEPSPMIHTKLSTDEVVMEKLQNRDWQYLIESLIYKVEKEKDYYRIKTTEDSEMIQDMSKNYRLLRRIHHDLYTTIAENFKLYLSTLTQSEFDEIDSDIINCGLNSLQNVEAATELLMFFDFIDFVHGRFPTTGVHTFIPCADLPMEVNGEELTIKKLYEKFRTTNSHALVSSQFLAALNTFFGGDPELSRSFLTEFYQNMTVSTFSTAGAFTFNAFTELSTSINLPLRRQRNKSINRIKLEDNIIDLKLKTKHEFDGNDLPPPPYAFDMVQGNLNTEPQNNDEKFKQIDIVEPKLETSTEIKQSDNTTKADKKWLDDFLAGVENTKRTLHGLNHQTIAVVLSEELMCPKSILKSILFLLTTMSFLVKMN